MNLHKPGDAVIKLFTITGPTGATADADSLPTASVLRNGVVDGTVTVTVTSVQTGLYKATYTIPSGWTAGNQVDVVVVATVASVTGKSVIESYRLVAVDLTVALATASNQTNILNRMDMETGLFLPSPLFRNGSAQIPFSIAVHNADGTGLAGQEGSLQAIYVCLDNHYVYDKVGSSFVADPVDPVFRFTADDIYQGVYNMKVSPGSWPRGHYAIQAEGVGSNVYTKMFSVGLKCNRTLGHSAVYNGTVLTLSVWVEEDGVAQTDYISLTNVQLCDSAGTLITGGSLGTNSSPTNGIFRFTPTVNLAQRANFILTCTAVVAGPASTPNLQFPLRLGFARP